MCIGLEERPQCGWRVDLNEGLKDLSQAGSKQVQSLLGGKLRILGNFWLELEIEVDFVGSGGQ